MATKIRLMRLGKMRDPYYRVVVSDSRTKRDGRAIETIGKYHPKEEPSFIDIDGDRALHWLRVGAQPTEAVEALLKVTGTWQQFKGLPAPEPMKVKPPKADRKAVFEAAHKAAAEQAETERPARRTRAEKPAAKVDETAAVASGDETAPAVQDADTGIDTDTEAVPSRDDKRGGAPAEAVEPRESDAVAAAAEADAPDAPDTAESAESAESADSAEGAE